MHCDLLRSITSELILCLWQTVEIGPLGHVRFVEAFQNFVQKCDPMTLSRIQIHIAGAQQFIALFYHNSIIILKIRINNWKIQQNLKKNLKMK